MRGLQGLRQRLPRGRGYVLHLESPAEPPSDDLATATAQINRSMEHIIRQSPGQYLWGYGRYKQPREDKQLAGEKA